MKVLSLTLLPHITSSTFNRALKTCSNPPGMSSRVVDRTIRKQRRCTQCPRKQTQYTQCPRMTYSQVVTSCCLHVIRA